MNIEIVECPRCGDRAYLWVDRNCMECVTCGLYIHNFR